VPEFVVQLAFLDRDGACEFGVGRDRLFFLDWDYFGFFLGLS